MCVAIGSDHAGFELKEAVKTFLAAEHHEVIDVGTHSQVRWTIPTTRKPGRGGGPGAGPVVLPETQDLVRIVSDIDVLERIRDSSKWSKRHVSASSANGGARDRIMPFRALACDYDGTLATQDTIAARSS